MKDITDIKAYINKVYETLRTDLKSISNSSTQKIVDN